MTHRGYFAKLGLVLSQNALDYMKQLAEGPLNKRLAKDLTIKQIEELQALNMQLEQSNTWLQEYAKSLQEELSLATTQNQVLSADIIRLRFMLKELEEK